MLTAVFLRLYQIQDIPPGLTHDEAAHGLTATAILAGTREIYFTIGHGREPLFDYAAAGLMALLGQSGWVLRATAVIFSLVMIAGTTAWARLAFNSRVALFTAAGLAVGFWPVMAGRQGLRSIALPALFSLAVYFFWRGLQKVNGEVDAAASSPYPLFAFSGLFLGLTFYTYIPARGLWLLFPSVLLLGALFDRVWLQRTWPGTLLLLGIAAALAAPLLVYLRTNPGAEIRLQELRAPLTAVWQGDFSLLWINIQAGLGIFTVAGDTAWRYNIAGRPLLGPVLGALFYGGILLAIWHLFRPRKPSLTAPFGRLAFAAALLWLLGGLAPVLITGPELSMTQGMGMQPMLYLFPALIIDWLWRVGGARWQMIVTVGAVLLFGGTAVLTFTDYFGRWATAPEVRVQYESTMTAVLEYLAEQGFGDAAVSTITPGPFHTPALAQLILPQNVEEPRWFDGRGSLLLPASDDAVILFSGFTQLPKSLEPYLATAVLHETLPLRPDDQDRPVWVYRVDANEALSDWQSWLVPDSARFGQTATLAGFDLSAPTVNVGDEIQLVTVWQLQAAQPGLRLFTHLVGPEGIPLAQADRLDAPSESWVSGDWLVQLHQLVIPEGTAVGHYPLTIGLYRCLDASCEQTERLPVHQGDLVTGDSLHLTELEIIE